jgi:hypothetical protein
MAEQSTAPGAFSAVAQKQSESVEKVGFLGIDFACRDYPLLCY